MWNFWGKNKGVKNKSKENSVDKSENEEKKNKWKKDINENGYNKGSNFRGMIKTENENDEKLKLFDEVEMDLIK